VSIRIARPGLLTTVQDLGRHGWQRYGIVVGGAMDATALRIANLVLDNPARAAGLEATLLGPTVEFRDDHLFALAGGDLGATLNAEPIPLWRPCAAPAGSVLSFTGPRTGCRTYLTVAGGIDVPEVLGSRSTDLRAGIGGVAGRALVTGDVLSVGVASANARRLLAGLLQHERRSADWGAGISLQMRVSPEPVVRVLRGLEYDNFTDESRDALVRSAFQVTSQSDRMGYRLEGPRLTLDQPLELISSPVVQGTVQVPPGGDPIVLMADRQTVGGYARIAQVIAVDLALLAQAVPGARLRFQEVTLAEAHALYVARERDLRQLRAAIQMRIAEREQANANES
jgi:antagonist of KipI